MYTLLLNLYFGTLSHFCTVLAIYFLYTCFRIYIPCSDFCILIFHIHSVQYFNRHMYIKLCCFTHFKNIFLIINYTIAPAGRP